MDADNLEMEIVDPEESGDDEGENSEGQEVYLPNKPIKSDEELICDESAYIMLHQATTGAPCLSFDIIPDDLGNGRNTYPLTAYIVAGTQAARAFTNNLIVMKMDNLYKTQPLEGEEDDVDRELSDDEDAGSTDNLKSPQMTAALIKHCGCVTRVRCKRLGSQVFAASWSELGRVHIWNISKELQAIEDKELLKKYEQDTHREPVQPAYTFTGHKEEGFAVDWSPCNEGVLATGDCKRKIHIWHPLEDGKWKVDAQSLVGHTSSVEDLQWSPNERSVLASCSVDKSIRIWDCRASPQKACMLVCEDAHLNDINVISWNRTEPFICSGGDDGYLHIWDLRKFQSKQPIATFKHHTDHITTVEWNPTDSTVLASGGDDNQIVLWDLAVERDSEEDANQTCSNENELKDLPPQLLFIHQGQKEIKELHWHPQIPGLIISTALSGFNVFKTISV